MACLATTIKRNTLASLPTLEVRMHFEPPYSKRRIPSERPTRVTATQDNQALTFTDALFPLLPFTPAFHGPPRSPSPKPDPIAVSVATAFTRPTVQGRPTATTVVSRIRSAHQSMLAAGEDLPSGVHHHPQPPQPHRLRRPPIHHSQTMAIMATRPLRVLRPLAPKRSLPP